MKSKFGIGEVKKILKKHGINVKYAWNDKRTYGRRIKVCVALPSRPKQDKICEEISNEVFKLNHEVDVVRISFMEGYKRPGSCWGYGPYIAVHIKER